MHQPGRRLTMSTRWAGAAALGLAVSLFAGALSPVLTQAAEDGKAKGSGEGRRHGHFRGGRRAAPAGTGGRRPGPGTWSRGWTGSRGSWRSYGGRSGAERLTSRTGPAAIVRTAGPVRVFRLPRDPRAGTGLTSNG